MNDKIIKITTVKNCVDTDENGAIKFPKQKNENVTEILNDRFLRLTSYYLNDFDDIVKPEDVKAVKDAGVDTETAFCYVLSAYMGLDVYKKDRKFFNDYFIPSVKLLDVNDYYADDYYKTIKFEDVTFGDTILTYKTYAPYQGFVRDDFRFFDDGKVLPLIGFFETEYRYPAVLTNGVEWMTLLPNEINSQKIYVEKARGKVLTYGVGLGYYVLKTALKAEVESVTAVDINQNVIDIFNKFILPCFPEYARKKVNVVKADAFKYAETLSDGSFDYIYADIWHDCGDGKDLYLKFKRLEKFCPSAEYGYWIEDSIKYYLDPIDE